jgi:uncharacterized protein involved in cysteine biosynthesis
MSDLLKGMFAPLRGLFFLLSNGSLALFLIVPGLIQLVLFAGLVGGAYYSFMPILDWAIPQSTAGRIAGGIVLGIFLAGLVLVLTNVLAGVVAAPILDVMSERILMKRLPGFKPAPINIARALRNQLGHAAAFLFIQGVLGAAWIVGLIFPVISLIVSVVSVVVTGYLLCVNHIDYPMGAAARRWRDRYAYFFDRPVLGLGLGTSLFFIQFIPFSLPWSVAGACLIFADSVERKVY